MLYIYTANFPVTDSPSPVSDMWAPQSRSTHITSFHFSFPLTAEFEGVRNSCMCGIFPSLGNSVFIKVKALAAATTEQ